MFLPNYRSFMEELDSISPMPHGRNVPRMKVEGRASILSVLDKDSAEGTLVDLSRKGVRLTADHHFQRDQKLSLRLRLSGDRPPIDILLAVVKWVRGNNIGVEFIDLEAEDQASLHAFLSSWSRP